MPVPVSSDLPEKGKTGFVALLGRPNTGKSTLLNTLLGCHLAAVSNKPQTTRKRMLGIYNDEDSQILFLDAPGVHRTKIAIDEAMAQSVDRVLEDADLVVCLLDPTREPGEEDRMAAELAKLCGKPVLLVLNKTDVATPAQQEASLAFYREILPEAESLLLIATDAASADHLLQRIKQLLPEGLFLFDRENLTDAYERDVAAELIREVLLEELQQEIPHSIAVVINLWKVIENRIRIDATLILEREAHKGIVIGQGGRMIKKIKRRAIQKIAEFCGQKVALDLFLKVMPNWRKQKNFLKEINLME
ncbi:MAG: GTPase Era [Lentisphaerae bacterium]|nr:GTPase Era [Lentisphaerota bacterium]